MKVNVYIVGAGSDGARRICWYTGTSDAQVEMAIRIQLQVPQDAKFLLRDADGDAVPVSSTLPNGHHYTLILPGDMGVDNVTSSNDTSIDQRIMSVNDTDLSGLAQEQVTLGSSPITKRRRFEAEKDGSRPTTTSPLVDKVASILSTTSRELSPPRSIATIIAQFVDTFTRPIANDDNVSFIPNTGRFALYALYCEVVRDTKFHPKREDVFYKMTSMHGKVDRQRVIRYYQCLAENGDRTEYVQCKPQGKGVLLRRYRKVGSLEQLKDVVKSALFISWLHLDPNDVVALYMRFVDSFTPIVKSDFRAHVSGESKQGEDRL